MVNSKVDTIETVNRCLSSQAKHWSMQWNQEHAFRWTKETWSFSGVYGSHTRFTKYRPRHIAKHMVQKSTGAEKFQFVSWILIKKNWCVINPLDPGRCDCEFYDFHTHYEVKEVFPWRGITGIFFSVSVVKFTHQYSVAWNRVLIRLDAHLIILWCINLETIMI